MELRGPGGRWHGCGGESGASEIVLVRVDLSVYLDLAEFGGLPAHRPHLLAQVVDQKDARPRLLPYQSERRLAKEYLEASERSPGTSPLRGEDEEADESPLGRRRRDRLVARGRREGRPRHEPQRGGPRTRSEEHTSELQSHHDLVCRLLLEKK